MANTFRNETYRSAKTFSFVVIGLLSAIALCGIFYVIFCLGLLFFPDSRLDLGEGESMEIPLMLMGLIGLIEIPLRISTIVFFLIWEYRAFNNLSALKATNLEYSPGWAVGWWFIPFANLVKPFQVMRELWNESEPDGGEEIAGFSTSPSGTPEIIGFWWAFFLISGITGRIADKMINSNGEISTHFPTVFLVASIFQVVAAILAIFIVRGVTQRQEARFQKISATQQFQPPMPPTF